MRRVMQFARNILVSNIQELKLPYRMTYILTNRCQGRCIMCNIWKKTPSNELTLEQIEEFFQKSNHFSWINLSGGEIFLRPDLLSIIRTVYAHCRDLYIINFPTNGFETCLIVDSVREILTDFRIPRLAVSVSLDGPPAIHDRIRNLNDSWNKAVETFASLREMRSSRFNVFLGWTLQAENYDKFQKTFNSVRERIRDIRYDEFHINIVHASSHYYGNTDFHGIGDGLEAWNEFNRIMHLTSRFSFDPIDFLEGRYQKLYRSFMEYKKTPLPCQALSASFFMDPSGTVYPCSIFDSPLGNIKDYGYSIGALWSSEERHRRRSEVGKGNCPQCWSPCEAYQSILANLIPKFRR